MREAIGPPGRANGDRYLAIERHLDRVLGPALVSLARGLAPRRGAAADAMDPARVLLIKLHGIGNVVMLLPALRLLRRRFPAAAIDFLSFSSNAGILAGTAELAAVHLLDRSTPATLARTAAAVVPRLRRAGYGLVVDFDQFAHVAAAAAHVTGAPRRVGFLNPALRRHRGYSDAVGGLDAEHAARSFLRLACRAAGLAEVPEVAAEERRIELHPPHRAEADAFLREAGIGPEEAAVLVHPGTSENLLLRRWPPERFAALADRLASLPGVRIVLTGGPGEAALAERVRAGMRAPAAVAAGRLSIKGFAALCGRAALVVANDTAAVHVSSAMGTPVAGLYGPNAPALYGPAGSGNLVFYRRLPCSPCITNLNAKLSSCRHGRCLDAITVDEVFEAIRAAHAGPGGRLAGGAGRPGGGGGP